MRVAVFLTLLLAFSPNAQAATIAWSPVDNVGNVADPATGFGAVSYSYQIGTYEVTNAQYVEFLNEKDPNGTSLLNLYPHAAQSYSGIQFSAGNPSGAKYSVIPGDGNHPVSYVSWYSGLRFANWLSNGARADSSSETGSYDLADGITTRSANATIVIPTENEWYKAAYFNPANSSYFLYPNSTSALPIRSNPTSLPNHENAWPGGPNLLTDVGAYTGTTSPYGAFDMGGNISEWDETLIGPNTRGIRGGAFLGGAPDLDSTNRLGGDPTEGFGVVGFRLAMVAEPGNVTLAALGLAGLVAWGWRRSRPLQMCMGE